MSRPVIQVEHVAKKYALGENQPYLSLRDSLARLLNPKQWRRAGAPTETFWALQDINFSVQPGEVVGLIGRNGAGKSTLLKILSNITPPTEGKIVLEGRVASLLEVGTGFHPELTGRENILLNGAILGMTKKEVKSKFDAIVEFAEISRFLDTPVKRYSSGMYVRLAFAVAAHLEPEIMLVDEVLAVGDVAFQKKCLGKMDEVVQQQGRTIVFVSHNMGAIQKLCKRTILLSEGLVIADGPTEKVIQTYLDSARTASAEIDLSKRTDRSGDGKIRLEKIFLQDHYGRAAVTFVSGQEAILRLQYSGQKDLKEVNNVKIAVGLNNHLGERVAVLNNEIAAEPFQHIGTNASIVITIPRLPLAPGIYYMTCFVRVAEEIADWIVDAGSFQVEFGDFYGTHKLPGEREGNCLIEQQWSVQQ